MNARFRFFFLAFPIFVVGCSQSINESTVPIPERTQISKELTILEVRTQEDGVMVLGFPTTIVYRTRGKTGEVKIRNIGDGHQLFRYVGSLSHAEKSAFEHIQNGGGYDGPTITRYFIRTREGRLVQVSGSYHENRIQVISQQEEDEIYRLRDHPAVDSDLMKRSPFAR